MKENTEKYIKILKENEELKSDNYELNNRINDLLDEIHNALKYIDNLENENRRLNKINNNTIKIRADYNNATIEIDTQLPIQFKEGDVLYIADSYKNPTKVTFVEYAILASVNNKIIIIPKVKVEKTGEYTYYFEKSLYKSKNKAGDAYLYNK